MLRKHETRQLSIRALRDERGISLIVVAVQILVLTAMCTFVLDYGMVWLGRRQAQNAADAGALSAVQSLAKNDPTWPAIAPVVSVSGSAVAQANTVLGAIPGTQVTAVCPAWMVAPNNVNCVQVDVYRDGTHGSTTMPVFFGRLIGQTSQSVKATATAQIMSANASGCMRPWFISDWYQDLDGSNTYNAGDIYNPPGYDPNNVAPNPEPGLGAVVEFHNNGGPSSYGQLDVGNGAADVGNAIERCYAGPPFKIGDTATTKPGNNLGQERAGINNLLDWDPDSGVCSSWSGGCVHWDAARQEVVGGCSASGTCVCGSNPCPYGGTQSPRIVQAAICAPSEATCNGSVPGVGTVHITNILSFFITGCNGAAGTCASAGGGLNIEARLIGSAGMLLSGGAPGPGSSFVTVQLLVR